MTFQINILKYLLIKSVFFSSANVGVKSININSRVLFTTYRNWNKSSDNMLFFYFMPPPVICLLQRKT